MTALEIKQLAESYIEEFIEDRDAVFFLNLCLNEIGDQALVYETAEGDILNPNEWYVLPETTTHVRKVEKNGKPYYDYEIVDNRIRFKHPGTYTIHYRRLPARCRAFWTRRTSTPPTTTCWLLASSRGGS